MSLAHPGVAIALDILTARRRPTRARCTFATRCRHCDHTSYHTTAAEARTTAAAHADEFEHDAQMSDWNGWHRP